VKTRKVREELNAKTTVPEKDVTPKEYNFKIGDNVQLLDSSTVGEVLEIKRNKVTLQVGGITTKTSMDKLVKSRSANCKKKLRGISVNHRITINRTSFRKELDVRGLRTYEALSEIDTMLDNAIMLSVGSLRILHGQREWYTTTQEIRRHLKTHPDHKTDKL